MAILKRYVPVVAMAAILFPGLLAAQNSNLLTNQSSAENPYYGSIMAKAATPEVMLLSIDDAIQLGIQFNLALVQARSSQKAAAAQTLQQLQPLLPSITAQGSLAASQINLEAEGFNNRALREFSAVFPDLATSGFSPIVKFNTALAQVNYSQTLFSLSNIDRYREARALATVAYFNVQSSRGLVVLGVGRAYLEALAARARVDNASALLRADQLLLDQTVEEHKAGTVANLDELRARVQFQAQQQVVIATQNDFQKSKIALQREIGLPPEQQIQLTDAAPFSDLADMEIAEARQVAYKNRQDYQGIQARIRAAELDVRASKWERLPALSFTGNYGVTGIVGGLYHGTFAAIGTLNVPLFEEAKFRGDREAASSNLLSLMDQFSNLKQQIDQQLRDSLLDIQSTRKLVQVARSNVDLAQQELQQSTERFTAGVDDNLPVVQAEATLASAQANLVATTTQFNEAKLGLARNLGIVDTQYTRFLRGQ